VNLRSAELTDVPLLLAIERSSRTAAHWTRETYENIFSGEGPARLVLIAEGSEILGFLVARIIGPDWELENIVVKQDHSRRGLGSLLMSELLHRAIEKRATVSLEVRESNVAARALYEKVGFMRAGGRTAYYRDPEEDAICYRYQPPT
jgi:ribosomal-protein-alanine N-acetyltransferase